MENNSGITATISTAVLIGLSLLMIWLYRAYKSKKSKKEVEGF